MSPTPPLSNFFKKTNQSLNPSGDQRKTRITQEVIDQIRSDGRLVIRGYILPSSGIRIDYKVGEVVSVAWNKDGIPQLVFGHNWRRSEFPQAEEEISVGDVQVVTDQVVTIDEVDQAGVAFSSANLGKFAVSVEKAPLNVPAGFSGVVAKWCQDDPTIVMWIGADDASDPPRIAVLLFKIKGRNNTTGLFGRTGETIKAGSLGDVPEVRTELISLIFWEENEIILRRVKAKPTFVDTLVFARGDREQSEGQNSLEGSINISYSVFTREDPPIHDIDPETGQVAEEIDSPEVDIEYTVEFDDMVNDVEYYCVVLAGAPEVLALIKSEVSIDNKEFLHFFMPERLAVVFTKMQFENTGSGETFDIISTPVFNFDPEIGNAAGLGHQQYLSTTFPTNFFRNPVLDWFAGVEPIYILNLTTKEIVARSLAEDVTVAWKVHVGWIDSVSMTTSFAFGEFRFKTGFGLSGANFSVPIGVEGNDPERRHVIADPDQTTKPEAMNTGGRFFGDKPTPNPHLSAPWTAEFDAVPIEESFSVLLAKSFIARITRFFPGSPNAIDIGATTNGLRYGGGNTLMTRFTQSFPNFPANQGYIDGLKVFVQAVPLGNAALNPNTRDTPFVGEWLPASNNLVEIPGLGEAFFPFQSSIKWGLSSLEGSNFALFDRVTKTLRNISTATMDKFGGSLIDDLVMTPKRLFRKAGEQDEKRLLIISLNPDTSELDFSDSSDILVTRSAWPDFSLSSDSTAVIFPQTLEAKGSPGTE